MVSRINLYNNLRKGTDRKIKDGVILAFSHKFLLSLKTKQDILEPFFKTVFLFYCPDEVVAKTGHSPYVQTVSSKWDLSQHKL
jgi:hypothetical protein